MAFAAGYKGHECLARSANTFQLRAHHIGQGSRAKWTRRTSIKFGMLLPSAIHPPHPGGLQHFPQLRSSVKAVGPGSSRSGGCTDDATCAPLASTSSSGGFEIVT